MLVVDKAAFPREKCCGDGLTALALRQLEALGLDPSAVASWTIVDRVVLHSPSGRRVPLQLPAPPASGTYGVVARRRDLDHALVERARAEGVVVREQTPVTGASQDGDGVTLDLGGAEPAVVRAGHVVGADGVWSPLRRLAGLETPGYRGDWHAFRQYFRRVGPDAASQLHVLFEADLLPGYAWSFPLGDGRANVGFGVLRGSGLAVGDMGARWRELLDQPRLRELLGPRAEPEAPHRAWPIPARLGAVPLHHGRILFVGDAAAVTDPLTGEGIGQALLSGVLAGRAIHATPTGAGAEAAARYEAALRAELGAEHRLSLLLGRILARPRATRGALRLAGLNDWTGRNFARWMFEDYPRALLVTPRRWRRGRVPPRARLPAGPRARLGLTRHRRRAAGSRQPGRRSSACWLTLATSTPSAVWTVPVHRPRAAPVETGQSSLRSHRSTRAGRWNHTAWSRLTEWRSSTPAWPACGSRTARVGPWSVAQARAWRWRSGSSGRSPRARNHMRRAYAAGPGPRPSGGTSRQSKAGPS